ncbi:hypothetical protein ACFQ80_06055 [Isoptericola sp. NPDC056578]|uniref:hypothetical protein n=1 Tax=Isoptericola sp. NPDC056578 TaxID=3345870 RepID=UPI00369514A0
MAELWLHTHMDPAKRAALLRDVREGGRLASYGARYGEMFGAFMYLVDLYLRRRYGVTHADLADFDWRAEHVSGNSPADAANAALAAEDLLPPGLTR